jgi:hypothetical protein
MNQDQRRALAIIVVIVVVIALLALGVGWIAVELGAPPLLAVGIAVVITAVVGLFMFLQLA